MDTSLIPNKRCRSAASALGGLQRFYARFCQMKANLLNLNSSSGFRLQQKLVWLNFRLRAL